LIDDLIVDSFLPVGSAIDRANLRNKLQLAKRTSKIANQKSKMS